MSNAVGLAVALRVRLGPNSADRPGGVVDPARIVALFSDAASELMIRLDGDEGVLRGFQQLEILGPAYAGDFIEVTGVLTRLSNTSRQIAFEARRVVSYTRTAGTAPSAADAFPEPIVVCRALGTSIVPRSQQRHPRLIAPALPATSSDNGRLPEGHVVVTPPPNIVITPPRTTPPEIVIAASLVGGGVTRDHTPHIPVTPEEIGAEARRCQNVGASTVVIGLDPSTVQSAEELTKKARDIVDAIRANAEVVIILSALSPGAVSSEVPLALSEAGAEIVSTTTGSSNFGDSWIENPRDRVRQTAAALHERGSRVLFDCLEFGHIDEAVALAREKLIAPPLRIQVVLGVPGALGANDDVVRFLSTRIPRGALWFAAGVGRHQRPVTEVAARCGGHIRVGLADNIYLRRGVLAEGSAPFVDRAATFSRSLGRDPVNPARARALLRLVNAEQQPAEGQSPDPSGPPEESSTTTPQVSPSPVPGADQKTTPSS